jgi:hypothetical protein
MRATYGADAYRMRALAPRWRAVESEFFPVFMRLASSERDVRKENADDARTTHTRSYGRIATEAPSRAC